MCHGVLSGVLVPNNILHAPFHCPGISAPNAEPIELKFHVSTSASEYTTSVSSRLFFAFHCANDLLSKSLIVSSVYHVSRVALGVNFETIPYCKLSTDSSSVLIVSLITNPV